MNADYVLLDQGAWLYECLRCAAVVYDESGKQRHAEWHAVERRMISMVLGHRPEHVGGTGS